MSMEWESPELITVRLGDRETGKTVFRESFVAGRPLRGREAAAVAARIAERLYSVR
jgi:hypothetical protein